LAKIIEVDDLAVNYNDAEPVFSGLNLTVKKGEFVSLVGSSGSGKSTILRAVADLIPTSHGCIRINSPQEKTRRPFAIVFQAANLMPWRTVYENVALGLEGLDLGKDLIHRRINSALNLVGLTEARGRWPYQLSGGQRQRIGIARALAVDPDILLMDEPFGALDAITRTTLQKELLRIWSETKKSILFVTHDIEEAVYLSDRVLLIGGQPAQIIEEYNISISRKLRREHSEFLDIVKDIRKGLQSSFDTTVIPIV
tara:strand:- start:191 stop:955 length:765 start_codon:yes stop_codon:yes gene_type:complete